MKTKKDCTHFLRALGLNSYSSVIVHDHPVLRKVLGQAGTFMEALLSITTEGNVFSYALIEDNREPYKAGYETLEEADMVRKEMLEFDIKRYRDVYYNPLFMALTQSQGRLFGNHPSVVVCINGQLSRYATRQQPLDFPFGSESPFQTMVEAQAKILVFGQDFSALHELRNAYSQTQQASICIEGGAQGNQWHEYFDYHYDVDDFTVAVQNCQKTRTLSFEGVNAFLIDYGEAVETLKKLVPQHFYVR